MIFEVRRAVLLAIDLQVAFCARNGSMARQGRDISGVEAAADNAARLVAVGRQAKVPVVWTRMVFEEDYSDGGLLIRELRPNLARVGALRRDTRDADLVDGMEVAPDDRIIDKQRFSAFFGTDLEQVLASLDRDILLVCGVTTSMCVESTVRDAGQRDFRTFVAADCCGDFDERRNSASLASMAFGFARVISSTQAEAALRTDLSEFPAT